jgi:thioesterase domain-containing protein
VRGGRAPASRQLVLDELAAATLAATRDQPYVLAGYSSGGVIARALAVELERRRRGPQGVLMIDTYDHADPSAGEVLVEALQEVVARQHAFVDLSDAALLGFATYLRLFGAERLATCAAPVGLLRATRPLSSWKGRDSAHESASVDADHFSIIAEDAAAAAVAFEPWLRAWAGQTGQGVSAYVAEAIRDPH